MLRNISVAVAVRTTLMFAALALAGSAFACEGPCGAKPDSPIIKSDTARQAVTAPAHETTQDVKIACEPGCAKPDSLVTKPMQVADCDPSPCPRKPAEPKAMKIGAQLATSAVASAVPAGQPAGCVGPNCVAPGDSVPDYTKRDGHRPVLTCVGVGCLQPEEPAPGMKRTQWLACAGPNCVQPDDPVLDGERSSMHRLTATCTGPGCLQPDKPAEGAKSTMRLACIGPSC